jgi:hypothetical protein
MSADPESEKVERSSLTKTRIMLGFFDVLGFSKRVESEGPEETAALYNRLIDTTVKKEAQRCLGAVSDGTGKRFLALFNLDVQHAYFSDTIFMWVPLERVFADAFVSHCATFVCEALALDVPVRGVIALGEAVMDRASGTYIGMPIVESASCEKIQEWVGVVFAPSATWSPFLAEVHPNQVIEYDVPAKPNLKPELPPIALDWTRRWEEMHGYPAFKKIEEMIAREPHEKLTNTLRFARFYLENKNWHQRPPESFEGKLLQMRTVSQD